MKFSRTSLALIIASFIVCGGVVVTAWAQTPAPAPAVTNPKPPLVATINVLTSAGYHEVTAVAPAVGRFEPPVQYFHVQESVTAAHPEWGDSANVVAVLVRPMTDTAWQYNNGQPQTVDYAGRTQVRLSRPGYYIVVTGPETDKVTALAEWLKAK